MFANEPKSPDELRKHITSTYFTLRVGIAVIALALPLLLWLGGLLWLGLPLKDSMSAYYHSGMRDAFVGVLYATGAFLYLYKGFSDRENYALNVAGVLAVCIAMFPTGLPGAETRGLTLHGASAVLFFVAIAYVCIFRASDTLPLMRDRDRAARYSRSYRWLGIAMVASPATAYLLTLFASDGSGTQSYVFFVELVGVWTFAAYWWLKSLEMKQTDAERLAMKGAVLAGASGQMETVPQLPGVAKREPSLA